MPRVNTASATRPSARLDQVRQGGGEKYLARHREQGKMPVRERIDALLDGREQFESHEVDDRQHGGDLELVKADRGADDAAGLALVGAHRMGRVALGVLDMREALAMREAENVREILRLEAQACAELDKVRASA